MSAIVSFGSCNVMLMGGGLAPFADVGGLPVLQRGGWVASPYEFGFSAMLKDVVLFFSAERGGGCLSGRYCFCSWLLVTCPREWAVWLLFSLVSFFFF